VYHLFAQLRAALQQQISDPLSRAWATVFSGTLGRLLLGFVSSVLIARALGPHDFGIFATLAVVAGISGVLADLGLSATVVKRVAKVMPANENRAAQLALAFLQIRLLFGVVFLGISVALCKPLATLLPGNPAAWLVLLALLGVVATNLSGSLTALLQALGAFRRLTLVLMVNSLLTTILAIGLFVMDQLNIATALAILGIVTSLISMVLGWWWLPVREQIILATQQPIALQWQLLHSELRELLRFGSWVWLSNGLAMLASSLDLLLVGYWLPQAAIGPYALASNLASKADSINQSLHAVLLPSAAQLHDQQAIRSYLRRSLLRSAGLSLMLVPLFLLADPVLTLIYGAAFRAAIPIFLLLLGIAILDIWLTPLLLLVYTTNRPWLLAGADSLRIVTLIGSAAWLLPLLQLAGMPVARLAARLAGACFILFELRLLLRSADRVVPTVPPSL
jgi:O-antigen/teichoic acid export membrane protein